MNETQSNQEYKSLTVEARQAQVDLDHEYLRDGSAQTGMTFHADRNLAVGEDPGPAAKLIVKSCQSCLHCKVKINCGHQGKKITQGQQIEILCKRHRLERHICEICGKCCSQSLIQRHKHCLSHKTQEERDQLELEKEFDCSTCGTWFMIDVSLRNQVGIGCQADKEAAPKLPKQAVKRKRMMPFLKFKCKKCDKTFKSEKGFACHQRLHSEKSSCPNCSLTLDSTDLNEHKLTCKALAGLRPFKCQLCDKNFKSHGSLWSHNCAVHNHQPTRERSSILDRPPNASSEQSGAGPLVCDTCGTVFKNWSLLQKHLPKHSQEKPYSCDVCSMSFGYKYSLTRHKKKFCQQRSVINKFREERRTLTKSTSKDLIHWAN